MRDSTRDLITICRETLPLQDPVCEFGSYLVQGAGDAGDLRPLFAGRRFVGADMRAGPGVDVILNLHDTGLQDKLVGTVLCIDTLEHVEYPRRAMAEIHRILKPGGIVIITSVMDFPIHAYPNDYWRFTPEAFRSLMKSFGWSAVYALGRQTQPHTVLGVACRDRLPAAALAAFGVRAEAWRRRWRWRIFRSWKEAVRLLMPPLLLEAYMKCAGE